MVHGPMITMTWCRLIWEDGRAHLSAAVAPGKTNEGFGARFLSGDVAPPVLRPCRRQGTAKQAFAMSWRLGRTRHHVGPLGLRPLLTQGEPKQHRHCD